MAELDVRIERLPPMRVAWVRAVGRGPEHEAWPHLSGWARPAGLLDDPEADEPQIQLHLYLPIEEQE